MTVEDFIHQLPSREKQIVKTIRSLIFEEAPSIQEKLSYGVPYFYHRRRICFLWPASANLGPKDCLVLFGFCYGNLLSNDEGLLLREGRKQVCMIKISSVTKINDKLYSEIIREACLIDELKPKTR